MIVVGVGLDGEEDSERLWGAIAGLRADIERIAGRVERMSQASGQDTGSVEEAAEAWKKEREKRLREMRGEKGEELDERDLEDLGNAWLSS